LDNSDLEKRVEEYLAIAEHCASRIQQPFRSTDHGALLYDESGMPLSPYTQWEQNNAAR
jgi:hypothetical protein